MVARHGLSGRSGTGRLRALLCLSGVLARSPWPRRQQTRPSLPTRLAPSRTTSSTGIAAIPCTSSASSPTTCISVPTRNSPTSPTSRTTTSHREIWTANDGRWFTLAGNGIAKDVKVTQVSGTVYEFTFHNSGHPIMITDSSGSRRLPRPREHLVQVHDRPRHRRIQLPRGQGLGTPPALRRDLCKVVAPLVGTDSAQYLTPRPIGSTSFPMGYYEYLPPELQRHRLRRAPCSSPSTATARTATGPPGALGRTSSEPASRGSSTSADGRPTGRSRCSPFSTSRSPRLRLLAVRRR